MASTNDSQDQANPQDDFDARTFRAIERYLKDPLRFPKEFKAWMPSWVQQE